MPPPATTPSSTAVNSAETSHLSAPVRYIPIIVVPGIMGTRLAEPHGSHELVWNPTGGWLARHTGQGRSPGDSAADPHRLSNVEAPLDPDVWNTAGYDADRAARAADITNFYHLIPDFYDDLCFALNERLARRLQPRSMKPRVYCCGYDWRRSNALGAGRLHELVTRAQAECGGEQVILVVHSMGGLVARYYCRLLGGQHRVRALILLGSPSLGAVQPYAFLKRGILVSDDPTLYGLRRVLMNLDTSGSRDFVRAMTSMYQLLPDEQFAHKEPHWLTFDSSETGHTYVATPTVADVRPTLTDCTAGYDLYRDMYVGFTERATNRAVYLGNVDRAETFHRHLGHGPRAYMHPVSHAIVCTDIDTSSAARVDPYGSWVTHGDVNEYDAGEARFLDGHAERREARLELTAGPGDGKVPRVSSAPTASSLTHRLVTEVHVSGVEHGALPNEPRVIDKVIDHIDNLDFALAPGA